MYIDAEKDYLPDATEWDELFLVSKCNNDWHNLVELQCYDCIGYVRE